MKKLDCNIEFASNWNQPNYYDIQFRIPADEWNEFLFRNRLINGLDNVASILAAIEGYRKSLEPEYPVQEQH